MRPSPTSFNRGPAPTPSRGHGRHHAAPSAPPWRPQASAPPGPGAAPSPPPPSAAPRRRGPQAGVPRAGPRINGPPDVAQNGAEPAVRAEAEPGGPALRPGRRRQAGSTDWVASSLTRRFG